MERMERNVRRMVGLLKMASNAKSNLSESEIKNVGDRVATIMCRLGKVMESQNNQQSVLKELIKAWEEFGKKLNEIPVLQDLARR